MDVDLINSFYDATVMHVIDDLTQFIVIIMRERLSSNETLLDMLALGEPLLEKDHDLPPKERFMAHGGMIEVAPESRELLTINTHRGLFQYTRLPFGVKTAPALFQQTINAMLSGIPGTAGYLDDIIIVGRSPVELQDRVCAVLERVQEYDFRQRADKCQFFLDSINYYSAFLPSLHDVRAPLNRLLQKGAPWWWSPDCEKAFAQLKSMLSSDLLLTHYDPTLPIVVAADASNHGVGAAISHFGQADALSCLISNQQEPEEDTEIAAISIEDDVRRQLSDTKRGIPVTAADIRHASEQDPVLRQAITNVQTCWPTTAL
nr:unnamed protein product [Spirometra erinaceieuropaei]